MKKLLFLSIVLCGINSCNLNNPEANRIVGTWTVAESKPISGTNPLYPFTIAKGRDITFSRKGEISSSKEVFFSGGWCNYAKKYSVSGQTIYLEYGKANCIPLIPPRISSKVDIVELTKQSLKIRYDGLETTLTKQ